jgi:3-oxoacyl-[acyl-carrier-protein] synthase II
MRRVVITGIGAVTPLGNNIETTWDNLLKGRSGISAISRFDPEGLPSRIAGELKGFNPENFLSPKDILRLDPFIHYAAAASAMACEDAGLNSRGMACHALTDSTGVIIGSSRGGICSMESALKKHFQNEKPFSAYLMSSSTINMASSYISMRFNIKGPSLGISTACASGTNALGEAFRMVRDGYIDVALTGGAEAPVCRLAAGGYGASGSLSKRNDNPEKASRPFDKNRDGFVLAEGAGILVFEELEHALVRGARIYAELAGYGASSDAFHQTQPDSKGESAAISKALQDAGVSENSVIYINAHATSTQLGDRAEADAIKTVFGAHTGNIHISSSKSMLGHMLGAAGAVEAALSAMSVNRGVLLPSINIDTPDPDINLNYVTAAVNKDIDIALTNSFGFGGVNAVLVIKKYINP